MKAKSKKDMFSPATTLRASEAIYNQIFQKIVSKELRPGDHLPPERELATIFKRSRPSVREALRMLQQDGLIKIQVGSGGGSVIQGLSMESVQEPLRKLVLANAITLDELIEYRHINDRGCARLAALHRTNEDIENLKLTLENALNTLDDPLSFQEHDLAFHVALAKASHNSLAVLLNDVIVGLNTDVLRDSIRHFNPEQHRKMNYMIYESHNNILTAIINKDPEGADKAVDAMVKLFTDVVQKKVFG